MRRKYKRGLSRKSARWLRIFAVIALVAALLVYFDTRLRPVITTMAQYQCRVVSMLAMNEAIMAELEEASDTALANVRRGENGTVVAIETDAAALNALKARLTQAVSARLMELEKQEVRIPLGTLLGWQVLAGRGPDIRLQIVPASFVQAEVTDMLNTSGINQTQHRIMICFTVEMSAILPGYSTSVTVSDDVCVAETLIVGDVPQFYAASSS